MPLTIKCAWCGIIVGTKEGSSVHGQSITHGICPACRTKMEIRAMKQSPVWDGIERRAPENRRKGERRKLLRHPMNTLLVIEGVVWIDAMGAARRRLIRRREDRQYLAKLIAENAL